MLFQTNFENQFWSSSSENDIFSTKTIFSLLNQGQSDADFKDSFNSIDNKQAGLNVLA